MSNVKIHGNAVYNKDHTMKTQANKIEHLKIKVEQKTLQIEEMRMYLEDRNLIDDYLKWSQNNE